MSDATNMRAQRLGQQLIAVWDSAVENHCKHSMQSSVAGNVADVRFLTMGLVGEAGELANIVKKQWRGDGDYPLNEMFNEIADVLAYLMMLSHHLDMSPEILLHTVAHKQNLFVEKMRRIEAARILSPANPKDAQ